MQFTVETERESDGRWIAEITDIPGAMKYGRTRDEAIARAEALTLRAVAERIETGEQPVEPIHILFTAA
uniref:Predicted nuclease of the RNAse H fold, HicB family n=1 Tax=Candidatus Kentrum sp. MB TaxID=2138164 RepID=A0A451B975_9GAMM|nr:MAG: Predicted nuclease of the RNAse H fold, HicB family [Candidatus Kentron sp. MB]VFK29461.1 MAG: Predicted nuclease of the RNAse H fold, HicB family [Candidatus Kentron sp. MB]VFK74787.1 MAG: Predicted nuclease of the RNAse H fold, HicB family [Candidatus Kentron sp. MB]